MKKIFWLIIFCVTLNFGSADAQKILTANFSNNKIQQLYTPPTPTPPMPGPHYGPPPPERSRYNPPTPPKPSDFPPPPNQHRWEKK